MAADLSTRTIRLLERISRQLEVLTDRVGGDDDMVVVKVAAEMLGKTENAVRQMVCRGALDAEHSATGRLLFRRGYLREVANRTKES
jgi:hypothetical protein